MATAPRLGELQERSIAHANARINIWEGAVRSGKTIASLLRWLIFVRQAPRGGALIVCGKTLDTVYRNVFGPLMDPAITGTAARLIKYTRGASSATILGRHIEIITANDARSEGRLRGLTAAGAYVDELTLLPEEFFAQLLARLSVPGAKLFATTNPDGPMHWARKKYLLRAGELDLRSWKFRLDDNPALDPAYVANLKAEYTGLWYRRFILGDWCLAEGAVYDMFDEDRHVVTDIPPIERWIAAGIDWGMNNPTHAVRIGLAQGRLYVTDEWRHDAKLALGQMTVAQYADSIIEWLGPDKPKWVVVDPSALPLRNEFLDRRVPTAAGDNEVLNGIQSVAKLLALDALRIRKTCKGLLDEFPGYSWDSDAAEKGEDKPIKADDHGLDALRYGLHTTEALWRNLIRKGARDHADAY
ncbi:PBSX family phage terminase large subunit [Glycomyces halotolerans]